MKVAKPKKKKKKKRELEKALNKQQFSRSGHWWIIEW